MNEHHQANPKAQHKQRKIDCVRIISGSKDFFDHGA
jgi:hypothetical protein